MLTSTTTPTPITDSISIPPSDVNQLGQEYITSVVETWRILRQRNITNGERAQDVENKLVQRLKLQSKTMTDYEQLQTLMSTLVPSLISQMDDLQTSLTTLANDIRSIEVQRDELIQVRNENLLEQHQLRKENELNDITIKLTSDVNLHEKWVKEQRSKQVTKLLEEFKKKIHEKYEEKLKDAILNVSTPSTLTTLSSPIINKSTTTTSITTPLTTSTKTPLQSKTTPSSSTSTSTLTLDTDNSSSFTLNNTTKSTTTTTTTTTSTKSTKKNKKGEKGSTTPAATSITSTSSTTSSQPDLDPERQKQTALDILEQYANGIPVFDDEYIQ